MPVCGVREFKIPGPRNSASASIGSVDAPQVKLRNGSADRPRYEASQLSLTICNVEGLVVAAS